MNTLLASVLLALRLVSLGALCLPQGSGGDEDDGSARCAGEWWLKRWGLVVAIGFAANLVLILAIARGGFWCESVDWSVWGAVLALCVWRRRRMLSRSYLLQMLGWWCATAVVVVVAMLTPLRSEWLAGGWDPGVYQNESLAIARLNGLGEERDTIYALMTRSERMLFVRSSARYDEVLPSLPIDMETGALGRYFFPMTPLLGAWLYRLGGLDMLCRLGSLVGMLTLPALLGLLGSLRVPARQSAFALISWCLLPLWWYQYAIPTSEHLQILLVLAALALYVDALRTQTAKPWALGLLLFVAATNRFSFGSICAVLLPVAALCEAMAPRKGFHGRWLACVAAVALGLAWDLLFNWSTLLRLHEKDNAMLLVLAPFAVSAAASVFLGRLSLARIPLRQIGIVLSGFVVVLSALLAVAILLYEIPALEAPLMTLCRTHAGVGSYVRRLFHISELSGAYVMIVACASACWLALDRTAGTRSLRAVILAVAGALVLLGISPAVADIYPWALRRYIIYFMPLVALLAGYGLSRVTSCRALSRFQLPVAGLLVAVLTATTVATHHPALRVGDYVGLSAMLAKIRARIPADAIVVADDPRWATPLAMADGFDVINGQLLWARGETPEDDKRGDERLRVLASFAQRTDRELVWLTSTDKALALYKHVAFENPEPLAALGEFRYRTVVHSQGADHYASEANVRVFALYKGL